MSRRLSLPVHGEELLERLAGASRVGGLPAAASRYELLRVTFFDTPGGLLRDRRMTLRLRQTAQGTRVAELGRVTAVNLEGVVEETTLEAPVTEGGLYATLRGSSELASQLRALVEPAALRPVAALDVDREIRDLRSGWWGRPVHRVEFDRIVAHVDGATTSFEQMTVLELSPAKVSLEQLAERLRAQFGVVGDGLDTLERCRASLAGDVAPTRAETVHDVRVAIFLIRHGHVALVEEAGSYMLPVARGSGEELAREFLLELFHGEDPAPDLELVGFAPSRKTGSDLEVWLHECSHEVDCTRPVLWLPLDELMERVGAPRLRDPVLVATLLLLARSEIGMRLLREASADRDCPVVIPTLPSPPERVGKAPESFLDAELSILDFNQRVLELAEDPSVPLLERFRFLSIFSSNLDEFFVVRAARLKTEAQRALEADDASFPAAELLDLIAVRVRALVTRQYRCLMQALLPALAARGVRVRRWDELDDAQREGLRDRFHREIFPVLTPRAMSASPGHPFPRLESLGMSMAIVLRADGGGDPHVAHVPIPSDFPRFLEVPGCQDVIALEDVVVANAAPLFPAFEVLEAHLFRVSRLSDVDIDEDSSESLLAAVEDEVDSRPYKPVVRIEVQRSMPRMVRAQLLRALRSERGTESGVLGRADVFEVDGPIDLRGFGELASLPVPEGGFPPFDPRNPLDPDEPMFDILKGGDVLVHHPFDSFSGSVGRFLREAAADPDVVAIKLTLYRTGRDSPVMDALLEALQRGKEVSVFVELKARFDEESNISWTHRLVEAGAHVVYGLVGYKTHAKTALVIRREASGVQRYVHIGTGNYNAATARFYTDLGLMSADPDLGADLADFFNELTGSAGPPSKDYRRLWVAPHSLAREILRAIDREIAHARAGRPARIQIKVNGLTDRKLVKALYRASRAGVEVDLVVRAMCALRPGVPGLSERIRVRSILGRFLEHARILYFENGGQGEYYIGSADWRKRNVRRRVEIMAPVDDAAARARLRRILDTELADPTAWILRSDGAYQRLSEAGASAQVRFLQGAAGA